MRLALGLALLGLFVSVAPPNVKSQAAPPASPPTAALVNLTMRATPLELIAAIGLQTKVPIGILPGEDADALCKAKSTFVFLGDDPRDALDAIAQQIHFTLNQEDGVFLLTAPDVTPHQREVLDHRFRIFRFRREPTVQMISAHLNEALWAALSKSAPVSHAGAISHSVSGPKIALPRVLHNVTAQQIAAVVVKSPPGGMYLSRINPSRMSSSNDLKIQFESYGDPDQLKLDMSCP